MRNIRVYILTIILLVISVNRVDIQLNKCLGNFNTNSFKVDSISLRKNKISIIKLIQLINTIIDQVGNIVFNSKNRYSAYKEIYTLSAESIF